MQLDELCLVTMTKMAKSQRNNITLALLFFFFFLN